MGRELVIALREHIKTKPNRVADLTTEEKRLDLAKRWGEQELVTKLCTLYKVDH